MAEPTCVMHPFSYTTPEFSNETHEENPMYDGTGESVSFGRFMTENLSWEKWSSFNNNRNRYVEEAEKYSRPGSVAQKKALFEAHFKRIAALKAANLLVETNAHIEATNYEEEMVEKEGEKREDEAGFVVHQNEVFSVGGLEEELDGNNGKEVINPTIQDGSLKQNEINLVSEKDENCNASKKGSSGITQMDKPPLQVQKTTFKEEVSTSIVKRNPPLLSYMPSIDGISSPAKSAASVHPGKENYNATPTKHKSSINGPDHKKRTPLRASINREFSKILSPVIKKIASSSKESKNDVPEPPPVTPNLAKRGFKSPSTSRNKISSAIIPTCFCLNSRERATIRKQAKKLVEKVNNKTTEKKKAGAELDKFRQSCCFKATSSPDHCSEKPKIQE